MTDDKHHSIRQRAHEMWEKDGRPQGRDLEHWSAAEKEIAGAGSASQANEGEGSRTAARAYNKHVEATVKSGKVSAKAKEAKKALEGAEAGELKKAEAAGKKRSKGEDPALSK